MVEGVERDEAVLMLTGGRSFLISGKSWSDGEVALGSATAGGGVGGL